MHCIRYNNRLGRSRCVLRNGVTVQCDTSGGSLATDPALRIGGQLPDSLYPYMGHIANFAVWRETLSAAVLGAFSSCQWELLVAPQGNLAFFSNMGADLSFVGSGSLDSVQVVSACTGDESSPTCYFILNFVFTFFRKRHPLDYEGSAGLR